MNRMALILIFIFTAPLVSFATDVDFNGLSDAEWREGLEIPKSSWIGEKVQGQDGNGGFYLTNRRASITLEGGIHVPPNLVGGIFLDFIYTHPNKQQNFQISWRFPREGWSLRQAAYFQLTNRTDNHQKVYIPFSEIYSSKRLGVLRFTFNGCSGCKLFLIQTRIVGEHESAVYKQYIPEKLSYVNRELPPREVVNMRIREKLAQDILFFSVYGLLIIGVIILGLTQIFRKNSRRSAA